MGKTRRRSSRVVRHKNADAQSRSSKYNAQRAASASVAKHGARQIWNVLVKPLSLLLAAAGLLATAYQLLGGPPWPTGPSFTPSENVARPFDVPFKIRNASSVFRIDGLKITCVLEHVAFQNGLVIERFAGSNSGNGGTLDPLGEKPYLCPIKAGIPVQRATIKFRGEYHYPALGVAFTYESPSFELSYDADRQLWVSGGPLR